MIPPYIHLTKFVITGDKCLELGSPHFNLGINFINSLERKKKGKRKRNI